MSTINERFLALTTELQKKHGLTKTAIAIELDVSQQYISKLTKTGAPSDLFVSALCGKFNVNREWLENGSGEMFVTLSRDEIITDFMTDLLKEEEPSFRKRFIEVFAALDPSDWEELEKIAMKIIKKD